MPAHADSADTFEQELRLAEAAALAAGRQLRMRPTAWQGVAAEIGKDVKVVADRKAETVILDILGAGSPHPAFSEECGWRGSASADLAWVVDPLDGSSNYSRDFPVSAVSIGLVSGGRCVLGVVYDFYRDELFSGVVGAGCFLNGEAASVSDADRPDRCVLMTGLPVRRDFSAVAMTAFGIDLARWRKVRMIGSAALAISYVAVGRADCYREDNVMLWDVAAGAALVQAAGGTVHLSDGDFDSPRTIVAHNGNLSADLGES